MKYFADRKMYNYKGARNLQALYDFVTEGYKEAPIDWIDTIPAAPSTFEIKMKELRQKFEEFAEGNEHLQYLLEDFDHIVNFRKNAAATILVMGAIIGFFFGMIVTLLLGIGKAEKPKTSKKKKKE